MIPLVRKFTQSLIPYLDVVSLSSKDIVGELPALSRHTSVVSPVTINEETAFRISSEIERKEGATASPVYFAWSAAQDLLSPLRLLMQTWSWRMYGCCLSIMELPSSDK